MKILGEKRALERLCEVREDLRERIRSGYENHAKDCRTCETPGACCLDAHFVNVRISRLEAEAIGHVLDRLPEAKRTEIFNRVDHSIKRYDLDGGSSEKFACPLFEKGTGCLVHLDAKPLPCIQHACYDREEDLPPDELLAEAEDKVDRLSRKVYGKPTAWLPLPLAIRRQNLPANNAKKRE
jgi:hypothetical protein